MRQFLPLLILSTVAACGDPVAELSQFPQYDSSQDGVELVAHVPVGEDSAQEQGLFARLFGDDQSDGAESESTNVVVTEPVEGEIAEGSTADPTVEAPAPKKSKGLFGFLKAKTVEPKVEAQLPPSEPSAESGPEEDVQLAALSLPEEPADEPAIQAGQKPKRKKGLLALFAAPEATGKKSHKREEAKSEIIPGASLPYGRIARVCDVPKRKMGEKIAQYPERGPMHQLFDSDPGNTEPHTFYLTGFPDGCARQFTASLAVFGSAGMHEQLRYGLPAEVQPYSDTDKAYEKVKKSVCKVGRRKPCGEKVSLLEGDTVFLSIYERFGDNLHWMNLLLHRGEIVAQDHKGGG